MSLTGWKQEERHFASLFGGKRFQANTGGPLDFETSGYVGQVKHLKTCSLPKLTLLAMDVSDQGQLRGKTGVLGVKLSAGSGLWTPRLIIFTESAWLTGPGKEFADER